MLVNYIYVKDYIYVYYFKRNLKISTILTLQLMYIYCNIFIANILKKF